MAEAFSLYVDRDSVIHRLNPLTKLAIAGFLLSGGLLLPGMWGAYFPFFLVLIPLAAAGRVLRILANAALRVALPFAISVFLIQGFLWPGGEPVLSFGFLSLKREGLNFATTISGRILVILSSFLLLALTTRPDNLMAALSQRGFPANIAYIVVATIQIVPRFQSRAAAIIDAQRARGLETEGNIAARIRAILPLVVPLILSSLVDVEERALAIEARGFNIPGRKTSLIEIADRNWEGHLRWAILFLILALVILRIWILIS